MNFFVSETTEEYILRDYPHLDKSDIKFLFSEGEIVTEPTETLIESKWAFKRKESYLLVPATLASFLNVNQMIGLIPDENGVICTQY